MKFSEMDHESRFKAILSTINTEFKSITLEFCLDNSWKTSWDLRNSYLSLTEEKDIVPQNSLGVYCQRDFFTAGLVDNKTEDRQSKCVNLWRLNEDGKKYGLPSAALAIRTANQFDMSIYQALSSSDLSKDTSAPYNRARILMLLDELGKAREVDLTNLTELDGGLGHHFKALSEIGLIEYESQNTEGRGWSKYKWIYGKDPKKAKRLDGRNLTIDVAEFLSENPVYWDRHEVKEKINYNQSNGLISRILFSLENQGFVKKKTKFKSGEIMSEARITERGKNFVKALLKPVYNIVGDKSGFGEDYHEYMSNNKLIREHALHATELYHSTSPALNRKPLSLTHDKVIKLLENNNKLRRKEIEETIGISNGPSYLKPLVDNHTIKKERTGKAVFYSMT
jgi:DNA-binding PadR family transcriptional regulator